MLSPSVTVLERGKNRFGFGLFDVARKQLGGAKVAVYLSRTDGSGLRGPFVARSESLKVRPQYASRQTSQDPDSAKHVYVADVDFPSEGSWALTAVARLDGRLVRTSPSGVKVGSKGTGPPEVGDPAPRVHTPDRDERGRGPRVDRHAGPAAEVPPPGRPRRRPGQAPGRPRVRDATVVPEPGVRPGGRRRRPGAVAHRSATSGSSTWRSTGRTTSPRGSARRSPHTTCPRSRGRSSSTAQGIVRHRFEGAFSVGELERAVAKVR